MSKLLTFSYTYWPLITSFNDLPSDHTQKPYLLATPLITPTSHNFQPYISFLDKLWLVGEISAHIARRYNFWV